MTRDQEIKRAFEIADDSLQGVLGYHLYVVAMQKDINVQKMWKHLPDQAIPHTFSWIRFYQKESLTKAFTPPIFELYQSRISLIAMTSVFEVALENFILCLEEKGHPQTLNGKKLFKKTERRLSYKDCIKWAYNESLNCDIGDQKAVERLPRTFGMIDNARRLRNLIIHNHGLFNTKYAKDAVDFGGIQKELHPLYEKVFKIKPQEPTPILITTEDIIRFNQAHVETLHVLHNQIQKAYFGCLTGYDYRREKKPIEWDRVLWGSARVKILIDKERKRT